MKFFLPILLFIFLLASNDALATEYFVDAAVGSDSNTCVQAQTEATAKATIAGGRSCLATSDTLTIRAGTYTEQNTFTVGGTSTTPLTIQNYPAETPIIRNNAGVTSGNASIKFVDLSYITVTGLACDGTGVQTSKRCISIEAATVDVVGATITANTCDDWGGTPTGDPEADKDTFENQSCFRFFGVESPAGSKTGFSVTGTISNNTITNSAHQAIRINFGLNVIVENNIITGMRCSNFDDNRVGIQAIKDSDDGVGTIIRNNFIDDIDDGACAALISASTTEVIVSAIYCDTGPTNGQIYNNEISNVAYPKAATTDHVAAFFIESRCTGWTVKNNVVTRIGRWGLRLGSASTGNPTGVKIYNNTFTAIDDMCIKVFRGPQMDIRNNTCVVDSGGTVPIDVTATATAADHLPHIISHNNWLETGSTDVCRWGSSTDRTLASCQSASGLFTNTLNTDPLLTSATNLTLTSTSPAINVGTVVSGVGCNNPNCDIGAYEKIELPSGSCIVGNVSTNKIVCTFETNRYPGLAASNFATGWTARKAGIANTVSSVTAVGSILTITTASAYLSTDSCDVTYDSTTGSLTDIKPTAFTNAQKFFSVTQFPCVNQVTGAGSAITFVAAGSAAGSITNTSPAVTLPAGIAVGDLMVCALARRRSDAAVVSDPVGWTPIFTTTSDSGRQLAAAYRFYQTGDAIPVWVITGNDDDLVAQCYAWRNVNLSNPISVLGAVTLNGSAADIGPITGLTVAANDTVVVLGMRRDNWTSVATLSGDTLTWVEAGEPISDAGGGTANGVGLVADYAINGASAIVVTDKTFVVTGGSSSFGGKGVMFTLGASVTPPTSTRPRGADMLMMWAE